MNRVPPRVFIIFFANIWLALPVRSQVSFFQPPTYSGSGVSGVSIFIADFNGDGKLDILTSDGTMNLGNGDGTFTKGTSVSVGNPVNPYQYVLAVADFNGDGKPDVLQQDAGTLLVLLGNGDGTFQPPITSPSGASLTVVAAGDLNGDGKADVVGVFNSSLMVYVSKGDGTFAVPVSYNIGSVGSGLLLLGKFSGPNVDVALNVGTNELVFLGNGDGTFEITPKTSAAVSGQSVAAGDFNGDGKLDLAMSSGGTVYVLTGNGDGTFQAPVSAFSDTGTIAAADLRNNGKVDLLLLSTSNSNGSAGPASCEVYLGNGDGTFSSPGIYGINLIPGSPSVAVADFNGDGKLDIAASGGVLLGSGDGTFHGISLGVTPEAPTAAVLGDFEKKGAPDVAVVPDSGGSATNLYILTNDGTGALTLLHTYALPQAETALASADVNGDGNLDLIFLGTDPTTKNWSFSVMLGNGDGSFQSPLNYVQSGTVLTTFAVADFNGDHVPDLAFAGPTSDTLAIMLGNGDGTFKSPTYYFNNDSPGPLLAADFNHDGKMDLAFSSASGTGLLFGNGDGTFQPAVFPSNLSTFIPVFTADFNNDGKPDMLDGIGSAQVALGNGDGTFTLLPPVVPSSYNLFNVNAIADLDGDGNLDLLGWAGFEHPEVTETLLGNGDGTFGSAIPAVSSGVLGGYSVLIADMNRDGRPDIVFPWVNFGGLCGGISLCNGVPPGMAVLINTTPAGFKLAVSILSPASLIAGNSAASTVTVTPTFGFNGAVTFSCAGLPSGATCAFNPASIATSSGKSSLTIATSASLPAGTYPVQITGVAGSITSETTLSVPVQAAPDFSFAPASGSPTSQTIAAGQTANFSLALTPSGTFSGTVAFNCAITPAVNPAPTCNVPSSVQLSGTTTQSVSLSVGTTGAASSGISSRLELPPVKMPLMWTFIFFFVATCACTRNRKRIGPLARPFAIVCVFSFSACGGGGSSSHNMPGTPAGTYTVSVTATSGNLSHNAVLQVIVE